MLQLWFIANTLLWAFSIGGRVQWNELIVLVAGTVWLLWRRKISIGTIKIFSIFLAYVGISFIAMLVSPCINQYDKAFLTAPVLLMMVLIGVEAGLTASKEDWVRLEKTAVVLLLLAFAGSFFEMLFPSHFLRNSRISTAIDTLACCTSPLRRRARSSIAS